jgi:hypothetical protein
MKALRALAAVLTLSVALILVVSTLPMAAQSVSDQKTATTGAQSASNETLTQIPAPIKPVITPEKPETPAIKSPGTEGEEFEGADFLEKRSEYFRHQRAYPLEHIPAGARQRALKELSAIKELTATKESSAESSSSTKALVSPGVAAIPVAPSAWESLGPNKVLPVQPYPFWGSPTVSGRVTALAVDPTNHDIVYLGAADGGVWKTTDGGSTWKPLTDNQPSLAIGSISLDPTNPQTIYVGTGEQEFGGDSYYGEGILKSTDGGSTWTQLGLNTFQPCTAGSGSLNSYYAGSYIGAIAVDPRNNQVVLAGVQQCPDSTQGVFRSADGGQTWTAVLGDPAGGSVAGNSVVFLGGGVAYAALGSPFSDPANGVYKSTDDGQTWNAASGTGQNLLPSGATVDRIVLTNAPSNPLVLYALITSGSPVKFAGLYTTVDGGANWTRTNAPDFCTTQCFYDVAVTVSPTNANLVYAAGIYTFATNTPTTVIGSTDGGQTWTSVGSGTGTGIGKIHTDAHALAFSADAKRLYAGSDGGAWKTPDAATPGNLNWTGLNGGLATTQFYPGFAYDGLGETIGGAQDEGSPARGSDGTWSNAQCGDGGFSAIDTTTSPTTFYTACTYGQGIAMSTAPTVFGSWTNITTGINSSDPALFIPPFVKDPALPNTFYFGTNQIYKTTNPASSWASISPQPMPGSQGNISAIGVAPSNSATIYAGTDDSQVVVTTNSGATWTNVTTGLPPRFVTHVTVDPYTPATAYATFSGFSGFNGDTLGHIFLTTNTGASWTDISGNLPNIPVNDLVVDPLIANTLYAATDIGVFASGDGGVTWGIYGTGLPNVVVHSLVLEPNTRKLAAATHGRSAWRIDLAPASKKATLTLSPAALTFGTQLVGSPSAAQQVTLTVTGAVPLSITSITSDSTDFSVASTTCALSPSTLLPGTSCTLNVTYTPKAVGLKNSAIHINDNATGGKSNLPVQGTGALSTATLSPTSLTFAPQLINTTSAAQQTTVTVTSAVPMSISSITVDSPDFAISSTTCAVAPATVAAGATCTVSVTYTPTKTGLNNSKIHINGSFTGGKIDLPVQGTGTQDSITPSSLTFNFTYPAQSTGSQNVTLTNAGTTVIHIKGISITPDSLGNGEFTQTNTCGATLPVGNSCTITVTFTGLQFGTDTANLQITDDGAKGAPELVSLTGTQM